MIALVQEDAEVFACEREIAHARTILRRGTSAHRQLALFRESVEAGAAAPAALQGVVDWLIEETVRNL